MYTLLVHINATYDSREAEAVFGRKVTIKMGIPVKSVRSGKAGTNHPKCRVLIRGEVTGVLKVLSWIIILTHGG